MRSPVPVIPGKVIASIVIDVNAPDAVITSAMIAAAVVVSAEMRGVMVVRGVC